jgi:hypothetical protein
MPTGYTSYLQASNFDFKRWMTTVVPRAFGICYSLRDMPMDMTKEEIAGMISDSDDSYYVTSLAEHRKEHKRQSKRPDSEWKVLSKLSYVDDMNCYEQEMQKYQTERGRFLDTIAEIERLQTKVPENDPDNLFKNILDFAWKQLKETLKYDYSSPPTLPKQIDWRQYKQEKLDSLTDDIAYYEEKIRLHEHQGKNHSDMYHSFLNFIEENT